MNNKKIISIITLISLVFCLCSCGNNSEGNNGENDNANTGDYFTKDETLEKLSGTTLKYATWIEEMNTESGPVITGFEKETGIKVQLINVPQHQYKSKLAAMISADQAPDVYCDTSEWPNLLSVADSLDKANINLEDPMWDKSVLDFSTVNGKTYLVNTVGSMWQEKDLVFYNKKIFEENAITSPKEYQDAGNWTWETLLKCMSDVKNCGYTGGYIDPSILANSVGGNFIKYDMDNDIFINNTENSAFSAAWSYYYKALKSGITVEGLNKESFVNGQCGVFMSGTYGLKNTGYWHDMQKELIGFVNMPKMNKTDEKYPSASFIKAWGLCKGSKNPIAAGYFLRYYLDTENYKKNSTYDNAFISTEARDFYFELNSKGYDHIFVEDGVGNLMDNITKYWFINNLNGASKKDDSQLQTAISTIKNEINNAATAGTDILKSLK